MIRIAEESACGRFRYTLRLHWDRGRGNACWVMLNPSTADAHVDDATIRKCIGFTRRWGLGGIVVVNLWPWRATSPRDLKRFVDSPPVPWFPHMNYAAVEHAVESASRVVVAWGAHANRIEPNYTLSMTWRLRALQTRDGRACRLMCLGVTKDEAPRHPLMLAYSTPLQPYDEET